MRVERIAAPTSPAAVELRISPARGREARDRDDERKLGGAEEGQRGALPKVEHAPVEEHRGSAPDDEEEGEEEAELKQRGGGAERIEVEGEPALDEEERDQEPEADGGQLRLELLQLAPAKCRAGNHPGDEAAEEDVQPELGGEGEEAEDEQDRDPDRELVARLDGPLERPEAPPDEPHRSQRQREGESDEGDQDQRPPRSGAWSRGPV